MKDQTANTGKTLRTKFAFLVQRWKHKQEKTEKTDQADKASYVRDVEASLRRIEKDLVLKQVLPDALPDLAHKLGFDRAIDDRISHKCPELMLRLKISLPSLIGSAKAGRAETLLEQNFVLGFQEAVNISSGLPNQGIHAQLSKTTQKFLALIHGVNNRSIRDRLTEARDTGGQSSTLNSGTARRSLTP